MNKPIHPAVAEHVMEENERLRGLLLGVLNTPRGTSGRIILEPDEEAAIRAALSQQAEPAPAQDEREAFEEWLPSMGDLSKKRSPGDPERYWDSDVQVMWRVWLARATRPAQTEQPVAWLIDWPEEPELGHYFSDEPNEHARSRPLYAAPIAQTAPQPEQSGWISVEDRLPEYEQNVLVKFTTVHGTPQHTSATLSSVKRHIGPDSPFDDRWYVTVSWGHELSTVTHWMPLPAEPGLSTQPNT